MKRTAGFIAVLALLVARVPGDDSTAVGFRNDGTGHYRGKVVDKFDLATGANVRWKVALPDHGVSSPVVVRTGSSGTNADIVVVTCDPDRVMAFRLADGKEAWNAGIGVSALLKPAHDAALREIGRWSGAAPAFPQHIVPQIRMLNPRDPSTHWTPEATLGWSVATPVSDGSNVWAVGYRGAVGCIGINGELKWKVFVPDTCKGSPCLVDGTLIVTGGKEVFGLDPGTGSNRWRTTFHRVPGKSDMQTLRGTAPALWRHQGRTILVWSIGFAVDAMDGADLSGECPLVPNNSPCLVIGDRMVGRYARSRRSDAPPADGEPPTPWQLIAWDMSLADGKLKLKRAWTHPPDDRFMENRPNGSASAGLLRIGDAVVCSLPDEGTSDKGLAAAKLSDGTAQDIGCAVPRSSRGPFLQPSPAVAGDRMVLADQDGTVTVVDIAQFPWKVVGRTSVATPENRGKTGFVIGASPCIAGDALLIRTSRELICAGQK